MLPWPCLVKQDMPVGSACTLLGAHYWVHGRHVCPHSLTPAPPLPCPQHLGDFPYRLAQNNHLVYEYTPLPPLAYPELASEMYCHRWGEEGRATTLTVHLRCAACSGALMHWYTS